MVTTILKTDALLRYSLESLFVSTVLLKILIKTLHKDINENRRSQMVQPNRRKREGGD